MAKLEGFKKVAVIKYGCNSYHFAIYEDGNDYNVGDYVILSGSSIPEKISEIIRVEEAAERCKKNITAEVIGKIDISAFEKQRKEKEKLKKEMNKRKQEIQKILDDEYYASKDEVYAKMLKRYRSM
jgi:hypothetical protein